MCTPNRRIEKKLLPLIEKTLKKEGFLSKEIIEIKGESEGQFLEGTGSMIFNKNKENNTIFAAISLRTHENPLKNYTDQTKGNLIKFHAKSSKNLPFYHTNILLCIGEGFATVCLDSIQDPIEKKLVVDNLTESGLEIIELTLDQTEKFY